MSQTKPAKFNPRQRLIQLLHVGRSQLGMDDDTYRALIISVSRDESKASSKDLSLQQLGDVLTRMQKAGFKVKPTRPAAKTRALADDDQAKLLRHLWLQLHELGAVRDPSEKALGAFVQRQTKVAAIQWLTSAQASNLIESLKFWVKRTKELS